jgi:AmmeMemoRadiSam system protein B
MAGSFYAPTKESLKNQIEKCFLNKYGPGDLPKNLKKGLRKINILVSPHAGYLFSGAIAAHAYYQLANNSAPEVFIIMGPNHIGYPGFCIMREGKWKIPLGDINIDLELVDAIINNSQYVNINPTAHIMEHSIEVQLPFLKYIYSDFKIVPITVGYCNFEQIQDVGFAIANSIKKTKKDVVIISSTDFTHYGGIYNYTPAGVGPIEKVNKWVHDTDKLLLDLILNQDASGLVKIVKEKKYTMCGSFPVSTALVAAKELNTKEGKLLKYATSYDVQGSKDAIVGYGSLIFRK